MNNNLPTSSKMICKAVTLKGEGCRKPAKKGEQFCGLHTPTKKLSIPFERKDYICGIPDDNWKFIFLKTKLKKYGYRYLTICTTLYSVIIPILHEKFSHFSISPRNWKFAKYLSFVTSIRIEWSCKSMNTRNMSNYFPNLKHIEINGKNISNSTLSSLTTLTSLNLQTSVIQLSALTNLINLNHLTLSHAYSYSREDPFCDCLLNFSKLSSLKIQGICTGNYNDIENLNNLTNLSLVIPKHNNFTFNKLTNLTQLKLYESKVILTGDHISTLINLRKLSIFDPFFSSPKTYKGYIPTTLINLEELKCGYHLDTIYLESFPKLKLFKLKGRYCVTLIDNGIKNEHYIYYLNMKVLNRTPHFKKLRKDNIYYSKPYSDGFEEYDSDYNELGDYEIESDSNVDSTAEIIV